MARLTILRCDRCGGETTEHDSVHLTVGEHTSSFGIRKRPEQEMDLCGPCKRALTSWLAKDNTTRPGGYGPGWREECPHHVPCAGPCPDARLVRVR
jgi:hypothetical protein